MSSSDFQLNSVTVNRPVLQSMLFVLAVVWMAAVSSDATAAEAIRSNGKGGGLWSAPTTWQGGKVPTGESVVILTKDVVDLDASAGTALKCEELTVDPQGVLRVVGKNKTVLTVTLGKALRIFGGMIVDFSKDPEGSCEFVWTNTPGVMAELQASDRSKILWKGATNPTPNVTFRLTTTNGLPAATPVPKSIVFTIGPKMSVQCERVALEGLDLQVTGVDGSGLKYNEHCSFRYCRFIRGTVTFQTCQKIEFEGNWIHDTPAQCVYLYGVTHSRIVSNVMERSGPSAAGIQSYGSADCELAGNIVRHCYYGMNLTACSDLFLSQNRYETNPYGLFLNSCTRITSQRSFFSSNTIINAGGVYATPGEPMRFFDCTFKDSPTNANSACFAVDGVMAFDIINSPLQTYLKDGTRGPMTFSAYVDIFVTNDQNVPLGRVPIRVLSGAKVAATSRTEAIGAWAGHTPLPSSHRPLVLPWYRFAPAEGLANPAASMSYQVEVDGTALGYSKQTVPLTMDASYVRPDPEKPNKTLSVKLTKTK